MGSGLGGNTIGTFGVIVKAHVDSRSFKDVEFEAKKSGEKAGRGFALGWSRALRVTKHLAAASLGLNTIKIFADIERHSLVLANVLRISPTAFANFSGAFYTAGVNARQLFGEMDKIESKMNRLKIGEVDEGFLKSLGMLGVSFRSFEKMNGTDRLETVLQKALSMGDTGKARELMRNLYGGSGQELFDYARVSGKSLSSILKDVKGSVLMDESMKKKAAEVSYEIHKLYFGLKELGTYIAVNVGANLMPFLTNIKKLGFAFKGLAGTVITGFLAFSMIMVPITFIGGILLKVGKGAYFAMKMFGGLAKILGALKVIVPALALGGFAKFGTMFAWLKGITFAGITAAILPVMKLVAALGILFLVLEDIWSFSAGRESVIGDAFKKLEEMFMNSPFMKMLTLMNNLMTTPTGEYSPVDVKKNEEAWLRSIGKPNSGANSELDRAQAETGSLGKAIKEGIEKGMELLGIKVKEGVVEGFSNPQTQAVRQSDRTPRQ